MYAIIDIESNGGKFREESIIEIAIYRFDGHEVTDQFISLVNPEDEISKYVQKLTGITPKMVKTAPKFHELARRVLEITEGATLVGHNIEFDYRMLRQSFKRLGFEFRINTLDTIELSRKLIPNAESYSLGKLVKSLGIPLTSQHRASGDARATLELFKLLITKDIDRKIIEQQFEETNAKTYTNKVKELTQDLPADKGIIFFQNASGEILRCDYSENINRSAKRMFNSKSARVRALQENTQQVNYELTGTPVIAGLMIKNLGISRRNRYSHGLFFTENQFIISDLNTENRRDAILKFKTYSQAKKVIQYLSSELQLSDLESLNQKINLPEKNFLLISSGRKIGEKSFLFIEKGRLRGYGFFEINTQINTLEKIHQSMVNAKPDTDTLNELKISLLRGNYRVQEFTQD
ncbi:DNA polymerase-3 subunit epsilon [Cruoricaptor ignavus]|uniref:DNA polymerase-3 subunit epsilon n=1 Tax=Cruoricaptor ignavus TaxID=1118202 RepID=A0A1M6DMX4_9FLAO|nr:3'-5' exonuclease [Cruoricaptor ignavus]SHI74511.1 DNA polymerase-3 subunit epsilon [Cruoricaptor ignavus]